MDVSFSLIFGLPGQGMLLHLDALSLFFSALLLPQIIAAALAGMLRCVGFWAFVAGLVLILLAGSPFVLVFGCGLAGVASWGLAARAEVKTARLYAGVVCFSLACLIPALSLPASSLAFVLVVLAVACMAGLVPFYRWVPRIYAALPASMAGLMSGGAETIALYILIRYVFMTALHAQQPWWGVVLLALGAVSVLAGALRAALEVDLRDVLSWSTVATSGLSMVGIGIALWAETLGHQALCGLALQAVLLGRLAYGLFMPLLFIGAGEVRQAVGTTSLNWLGGLMRGMPRLGALVLLGAAGMAGLPLGPAFAPVFLLAHAVVAMALQGGFAIRLGCAGLLVVLGGGVGLLLLAAVKIIGLAFLGRPRSLHAAAAEDVRHGPFWGMALLGALCVPVALVPDFILHLCVPVVTAIMPQAQTVRLAYTPLTLCLLAGLALVAAGFFQTRMGVRGLRETPTWNGGFGRPPAWLPFGDPKTQLSASGFAESVRLIGGRWVTTDFAGRFLAPFFICLYVRALRFARQINCLTPRLWLVGLFAAFMLACLVFFLSQGG